MSLNSVFGTFTIDVVPIDDEIMPGDIGQYEITVENTGLEEDVLKYIFSEDPSWSIITKPISHQTALKIDPNEKKKTIVFIKPDQTVDSGQKYTYTFKIESKTSGISKFVGLDLFLRSPDRLTDYVPIVGIDVDINSEIDPRDETILTIGLQNFNRLNITELHIEIDSIVDSKINQVMDVALPGLDKKNIELSINYDPLQVPAKEKITVRASVPSRNVTFDAHVKNIQIKSYNEVSNDVKKTDEFLKTHFEVKYLNDGNVKIQDEYKLKTSLFKQIFTNAEPKPEIIFEEGKRYQVWPLDLEAQEEETINITMNYRPLFIIFILSICALVLYYAFRSPIIIKKQAIHVQKSSESSTIKVLLHIQNRNSKMVENVKVMDKVPAIGLINKDFPVGTLQPTKVIRHENKGTIVKWMIPTLEAYEERIITYKFTPKLRIIGPVKLPAAMVKFKNKLNKFSKVYSSKVSSE